jgi:hypothetical protein
LDARRKTIVLALLLAVLAALGSAAGCGSGPDCGRTTGKHVPCDTTYAVARDERIVEIAGRADPTARTLIAAGYAATGRISPGDQSKSWRLLLTRCSALADTNAAEACNQAAGTSAVTPKLTRDIKVGGSNNHLTGYRDAVVHVDTDAMTCHSVAPITEAALALIPGASRSHADDKDGTQFAVTSSGQKVFDCAAV